MNVEEDISRRYIVITPCKNEGVNLPDLIESMVAQTVRPVVWVIVDDGSADDTSNIIENAMKTRDWIQSIRLNDTIRDRGPHLASVMKKGFDHAVSYSEKNNLKYKYLGNLDGDLTLPPTFYENLMNEFEKDPELGVASGGTEHIVGGQLKYAKISVNEPSGGHMLIRRECFEECDGIPLSHAMDSVLKAKARIGGWKTKRFEGNVATEIRDVNAAEGYWVGFVHKGKASYYLNINPLHVMARVAIYSFRKPHYIGIAYLVGYLSSVVRREKRIDGADVKRYFWNKWKEYV